MKAVVIKNPYDVVLKEVPDPKPKPDEILLRPRACGLCGTDVLFLKGILLADTP